jgi:hypothetical protein
MLPGEAGARQGAGHAGCDCRTVCGNFGRPVSARARPRAPSPGPAQPPTAAAPRCGVGGNVGRYASARDPRRRRPRALRRRHRAGARAGRPSQEPAAGAALPTTPRRPAQGASQLQRRDRARHAAAEARQVGFYGSRAGAIPRAAAHLAAGAQSDGGGGDRCAARGLPRDAGARAGSDGARGATLCGSKARALWVPAALGVRRGADAGEPLGRRARAAAGGAGRRLQFRQAFERARTRRSGAAPAAARRGRDGVNAAR